MWRGFAPPRPNPAHKPSGASLGLFLLVTLGLMLGARIWFPDTGGGSSPGPAPAGTGPARQDSAAAPHGLLEWLDDLLSSRQPLRLEMSPTQRLDDWSPPAGKPSRRLRWKTAGGALYPGALRLWNPTLEATDYDFSFAGVIERRALSWAWRARGPEAYYAAKIRLPGPQGGSPVFERMLVEGARVLRREEFPLPLSIAKSTTYNITVAVRGARFRTALDGRLIDDWSDPRLPSGGVGFFAGEGETSAILWARFRERSSLLARLNLAFLLLPGGANL
jgi:hypothetical protein